jgi:hypothetical protein
MVYQLEGKALMFEVDRSKIIDISPGDTISIKGMEGIEYTWTQQDTEFIENNPDDDIFILVEKQGENQYRAGGVQLRAVETIK